MWKRRAHLRWLGALSFVRRGRIAGSLWPVRGRFFTGPSRRFGTGGRILWPRKLGCPPLDSNHDLRKSAARVCLAAHLSRFLCGWGVLVEEVRGWAELENARHGLLNVSARDPRMVAGDRANKPALQHRDSVVASLHFGDPGHRARDLSRAAQFCSGGRHRSRHCGAHSVASSGMSYNVGDGCGGRMVMLPNRASSLCASVLRRR
jgi:hypothetical protein